MYLGLQSMFFKYVWDHQDPLLAARTLSTKSLSLAGCRRDTAAFQAIVCSTDPVVLTTSTEPLFWKAGPALIGRIEATLDGPIPVQMQLIGLIPDDNGCPTSDVLLDQQVLYVEPGRLQQVWIECQLAADLPPDSYHGRVSLYTHTLFEDERLQEECTFTLTVKDAVLPEPQAYKFYLDLWQHHSNIARKYQVERWSDEHFAILERYVQSLAQLGQKAATIIISEIPWAGQYSFRDREPSDLFEYSMARVTKDSDGFHYDFSAVGRYIELAERYGMAREIELFGLLNVWQAEAGYGPIVEGYPDAARIRYYDTTTNTFKFMHQRAEVEAYIQAVAAYFAEQGWSERVRVLADEPADIEKFLEQWQFLHQLAPSFKLKVAINHAEFLQQDIPGLHDAVPIISCALQEHQRLIERREGLPGTLLYYVCCVPQHPNTFLSSPALESRVIPWLAERLGLDGFLRWSYTAWPDRPLEKISYRPSCWPAGDLCLVYPGARGKPLLSLRYKWLQRGIRDYELMQLAKAAGRSEWVDALLQDVFRFQDAESVRSFEEMYSLQLDDYDRVMQKW